MKNEIKATPESRFTSNLTPIVIQETPNVKITFDGLQDDNLSDLKKNIKGKIVIKKKTKKSDSFDEVKKFTRKDISAYDLVEITVDTAGTYELGKGLCNYYRMFGGRTTNPYDEVAYIRSDVEIEYVKQILQSKEMLPELLNVLNTDTLNAALNISNLTQIKTEMESNLTNGDENYWQDFFTKNSWALSQLFNTPLMIFNGARYVGGKSVNNQNGKYTDFIYKNKLTNNVSLIEIKTPCTKLFKDSNYRNNIPTMSSDLIGGVSQILEQKQVLNNEYYNLRSRTLDECSEDFSALNIQCILLMGKIDGLTPDEKRTFEIYRNELKSIDIITFDELLEKVNSLIDLLNS